MKAITYKEYGGPEVLQLTELEKPSPKSGEVLVRVRATPINYGDLVARNMGNISAKDFNMLGVLLFPARLFFGYRKPRKGLLGSEFAGDIESVGDGVENFKPGDAVFGYMGQNMGANAEYLIVQAKGMISPKPSNLDYAEAATLPYGMITAGSILDKVSLGPGSKVLIKGASGGIGSAALQLTKHAGAEVTAVCGTGRMDYVRELGADHVIDYTSTEFTEQPERYDLILDIYGRSAVSKLRKALKPEGILLFASFKMSKLWQMLLLNPFRKYKVICAMSSETVAWLDKARDLAEAGIVKAVIDRSFPLEDAVEAHRHVESGERRGSVVLVLE